jgi:MFS family permease
VIALDRRQQVTLVWAGLAVFLSGFEGSILVLALPAIAQELGANTLDLSGLGSVLEVGTLFALPLAMLADRYGRRRLIAAGVAGFSVANFLSGLAPSLADLAFLKLFAVCFEVLVASAATALFVEEAPPAHRGLALAALALIGVGGFAVTVFTYPIVAPHWRWLFLAGGVGLLAVPPIWLLLPEGKTWQGVRITQSALRVLMERPWRRRLLVLCGMNALLNVLLTPAGLLYTIYASHDLGWTPVLISILIVVAGIFGGAAYLGGGIVTDRVGRRGPAIALTVGTAAVTTVTFATGSVGFFIGNVLWSVLASAASPVFGAWSGEMFPTRARATAEATTSLAVAVGGIAGLQVVGRLASSVGLGGAIELGGVVAIAGALLLFLLPETKQQPLPE